ncbi:unnamed protein product [Brassicogethes aeneus]|uniref:Sperm microtubule inner protein 1 C-terminal domain-containing protein n=1 Tax=Brassicogethes aeneus TaxID=1431903 RepID=A0A9P0FLP0_BRAAE|nr:unnamed protein product [Brassicogethes aeneus]
MTTPKKDLTTAHQDFLIHMYEKETALTLKWYRTYQSSTKKRANFPVHYNKNINNEHLQREFIANRLEDFKHDDAVKHGDKETDAIDKKFLNIMKPVDPDVKKILISAVPDARNKYLKERYNVLPENRYYFPECTNFDYGWEMWSSPKQYQGFGNQAIIKNSFYRRNGTQRDPDWYREPCKLSPTICGII